MSSEGLGVCDVTMTGTVPGEIIKVGNLWLNFLMGEQVEECNGY